MVLKLFSLLSTSVKDEQLEVMEGLLRGTKEEWAAVVYTRSYQTMDEDGGERGTETTDGGQVEIVFCGG